MANISDVIESFLIDLFGDERSIYISRNELAQYFNCAPSQINYVLSTRFTVDKGFAIESRRGGGGYVTLVKLCDDDSYIAELVRHSIGDSISFQRVCQILDRLVSDKIITPREREIAKSMTCDKAILSCDKLAKDVLRAGIFKNFLTLLMKFDFGGENL
ncbi:MAG: CtsR family transcriptional regulator [Clostridiales bacterium]|nr:CtsR family transcriptional regulator [Clostridiales bacterium]